MALRTTIHKLYAGKLHTQYLNSLYNNVNLNALLTGLVIIFAVATFAGCSIVSDGIGATEKALLTTKDTAYVGTGVPYVVARTETESNFSSLFIDKTKPKIKEHETRVYYTIPSDSSFFILSLKDANNIKDEDEQAVKAIVKNYIRTYNYGRVVDSMANADYILYVKLREFYDTTGAKSTSNVDMVITEMDYATVFYTKAAAESNMDKEFYYNLSTEARPAEEMTDLLINKIMSESFPLAIQGEG